MKASRATRQTRAWLILPCYPQKSDNLSGRSLKDRLEEAQNLTLSLGLNLLGENLVTLKRPKAATLLGSGKLHEIGEALNANKVALVVVDASLTPIQQRNLERAWKVKVLDRTALILEIFAERAHTREGRLQVDLARLNYQKSRLVRSWTHLERQRGGFGVMGGPGERQLESDRRAIETRINAISKRIEQVRATRGLHRRARSRVPWPIVALVGYTNAGKSTLFNRLTEARVMAKDMPFATLDPTMRAIDLGDGVRAILLDTVGFIADLPTQLVVAFRATLEEICQADLIVHVRDISHPESAAQKMDVLSVLSEIGVSCERREQIIELCNKIDLVENPQELQSDMRARDTIAISARDGTNIDRFLKMVRKRLLAGSISREITLPSSDGKALTWLFRHGAVGECSSGDKYMNVRVKLNEADWGYFQKHFLHGSEQLESKTQPH